MEPGSTVPPTNNDMAKDADVSVKTIQQAKVAHEAGLGEQVRDGKLTAKKAGNLFIGLGYVVQAVFLCSRYQKRLNVPTVPNSYLQRKKDLQHKL